MPEDLADRLTLAAGLERSGSYEYIKVRMILTTTPESIDPQHGPEEKRKYMDLREAFDPCLWWSALLNPVRRPQDRPMEARCGLIYSGSQ